TLLNWCVSYLEGMQRPPHLDDGDVHVLAVQFDGATDVPHPRVETDEALAEGGLAAAGFPGQAHDLPVSEVERHAVECVDVPAQGLVVDLQVIDAQGH